CHLDGTGSAICTRTASAAATCAALDGCAADSVCDLDPTTHQGTCIKLSNDGEACVPSLAIGSCARIDQWCDPTSSTCRARKAIGATCTGEGQCIEASACVHGVCTIKPGIGANCGADSIQGSCLGDLACVVGTCTRIPAEGVCQ